MEFLLFPLIGALIGWITNWLALRLLFRPHRPVGLLGLRLQGLLPRRRGELAATVARVVEQELLSREHLAARLLAAGARDEIAAALVGAVREAVRGRMPVFVPRVLADGFMGYVEQVTREEVNRFSDQRLPDLLDGLLAGMDVAATIRERLNALDLTELEALVHRLAAQELRHIELLGAVVGGLVGLVQALAVVWWGGS